MHVSSKTRCFCGDQLIFTWIRFCRAPREDPKAMAEHNCPFFLPQRSSKLSTSTTTVQNECELKSAPTCSPRRQFGAKLCEYVPLAWPLKCSLGSTISSRFEERVAKERPAWTGLKLLRTWQSGLQNIAFIRKITSKSRYTAQFDKNLHDKERSPKIRTS